MGDVWPDGEGWHQYNKHEIASYMSQQPVFSFSLLPTVCACTSNWCPAIVLQEADTEIDKETPLNRLAMFDQKEMSGTQTTTLKKVYIGPMNNN